MTGMVRTLAIDCATEACSAALFDGGVPVDGRFEIIHRGHAERLVPMIAELRDRGRADRILVSLGPGSFTGVRIGLAAARALGLAWGSQVLGYPTLALVAAMARGQHGDAPVTVCMNGGHGEWFVQGFDADGSSASPAVSLPPEEATDRFGGSAELVAGNRAAAMAEMLDGTAKAIDLLPDARETMHLPASVLTTDLSPIYGRGPDATPQAGKA